MAAFLNSWLEELEERIALVTQAINRMSAHSGTKFQDLEESRYALLRAAI
jgi:uncharacterized small protein (DUF1192 family)